MIDEDKLKSKIEGLKSNLIHDACSSQIAMETRCKEEAYNEVLAIIGSMQEEPVSEDLEVELKNYLNSDEYINTLGVSGYLLIARHFANWQKNKMMEDAVDGEVGYWNQRGLSVLISLPKEFEEDDKCKIILIKED